jgi:hypothetical protein
MNSRKETILWAMASMKQGNSSKDTHNQHSYGMYEIHNIAHSHEPFSKPKVGTMLIMSIYDAVHILLPLEGLRPDRRQA